MTDWRPIETAPRRAIKRPLLLCEFNDGRPYVQLGWYDDASLTKPGGWVMIDEQCGGPIDAEPEMWAELTMPGES